MSFTVSTGLAARLGVALLAVALAASGASAQTTFNANPESLGAIPEGLFARREVTFAVTGTTVVQSVGVSMTFSPPHTRARDIFAILISPDGTSHLVFGLRGATNASPLGSDADLAGPYTFSDAGTLNFWTATGSVVGAGHYRTVESGGEGATGIQTLMDPVFRGRGGNGTWTLRFFDFYDGESGSVSAASLIVTQLPPTSAAPGSLGPIPDGFVAACPSEGLPRLVTFPVSGRAGTVLSVAVSAALNHSFVGDLTATLIAPNGTTSHVLFGHTGLTTTGGEGRSSDLDGTFTFHDTAPGNWWAAATLNPVAPGEYRTSQPGGAGATGELTGMDPVFAGVEPNGNWTLRLTDSCVNETGSIAAASLVVTTTGWVYPPTGSSNTYDTAYATPLAMSAPGVLGNDTNPLGSGTMTATLVTPPSNGTFTLNSDGSFTYAPAVGFAGADNFTYRPVNLVGSGNVTTVTLNVASPTTVQPPTAFRVDDVSGNQVTLRWNPPAIGPGLTGYLVEGGVAPGTTVGKISVGRVPYLSFQAPSGSFFVRVKSLDGDVESAASNEVPLHVNVPVAPSAPGSLTGLANGADLLLSWKLSYGGGEPTDVVLDVTGAATRSVSLGPTEDFTFTGVPGGTYNFAVRAVNAAGTSAPSATTSLTFPAACSEAPATPQNFLFFGVGNGLTALWDPPATGTAPTAYELVLFFAPDYRRTGERTFTWTVPAGSARSLSARVPSGRYVLTVAARNACGASTPTIFQEVAVS